MTPCYYVISNWFDERRGLAMTLAITGIEIGGTVMALISTYVIVHAGWRIAYLVLAAPVIVVVVPVMALLVRSRPETATGRGGGRPWNAWRAWGGRRRSEPRRDWRWALRCASALSG